jgi:hypothetical protein
LISKTLNAHQGLGPVDHPVAVGTDDRQVIKLGAHRCVEFREGKLMVNLAEVCPEIAVDLREIESTCFAFE